MRQAPQRPSWLREPQIAVCNWEPLIFRRRRGGLRADEAEIYAREHAEETVKAMASIGVNLWMTHFHKGFGLAAEKEDIEHTRILVERCHRHNMKVVGYIRVDNIFPETMFKDYPGSEKWLRVDQDGKTTGYHYYRPYICFNNQDYRSYLRKVIKHGIVDVGLDALHFDGYTPGSVDVACHCQVCAELFRRYLKGRYGTSGKVRERFGIDDLDLVSPPVVSPHRPLGAPALAFVREPLMQEWIAFLCDNFAEFHREVAEYIHGLNPETGIFLNSKLPVYENTGLYQGNVVTKLASHADSVFEETGFMPGILPNGVLGSKIIHHKMGKAMGLTVQHYLFNAKSPRQYRLSFSESLVFNYPNIGLIYTEDHLGGVSLSQDKTPRFKESGEFHEFLTRHRKFFDNTESMAGVAVLHLFSTMLYNSLEPYYSTLLVEQSLLRAKIPFDIVFDDGLDRIGRYKTIILAGMSMLSGEAVDAIKNYVSTGGGLVCVGDVGSCDTWGRALPANAFEDMFSFKGARDEPKRVSYGAGRGVHIPQIEKSIPVPPNGPEYGMYYDRNVRGNILAVPKNHKEIVKAVQWTARNNLALNVKGANAIVAELRSQGDDRRLVLHLLNYDLSKDADNIEITIKAKRADSFVKVTAYSYDGYAEDLEFTADKWRGDWKTRFHVAKVKVYTLVVLS